MDVFLVVKRSAGIRYTVNSTNISLFVPLKSPACCDVVKKQTFALNYSGIVNEIPLTFGRQRKCNIFCSPSALASNSIFCVIRDVLDVQRAESHDT